MCGRAIFLQASLLERFYGKGYFKRKVLQYYRRFKLEPQITHSIVKPHNQVQMYFIKNQAHVFI